MERLNDSQSKREEEPGVKASGSENTALYCLLGHEGGGHLAPGAARGLCTRRGLLGIKGASR